MMRRSARLALSWGGLVCAFTLGAALATVNPSMTTPASTSAATAPSSPSTAGSVSTARLAGCSNTQGSLAAVLNGGTTWRLCWSINPRAGLELTDAAVTLGGTPPLTVLRKAALAQIDVPYDSGTKEHLDMPAFGSMTSVSDVTAADCPHGELVAATTKDRPLLCAAVVSDGAAYEWDDYNFGLETHRAESTCLEIYTVTPADWYTYMDAWDFCGDGRVVAKVGASGTLAPAPSGYGDASDGQPIGPGATRYALNHYHNVFWRVQFGLNDGGPAEISTVETSGGAHRQTTMKPIRAEAAMQSAPDRSWMLTDPGRLNQDQHHVSYDIDIHNDSPYRGVPGHEYTDNDLYVSQNRPCEVLAAANSTAGGCAASVDQYVGTDKITDPVTWLQTSFHHLPRDEDEPVVDEHWQGFMLMPHDVTATNPLGTGLPSHQ